MYAPILLGLDDAGNDNYKLWICNDQQRDIDGRIRIVVEDMRGNQMFAFSEVVDVKANSCYRFPKEIAINMTEKMKSDCYARIIFMEDDTVLSEKIHIFKYPKDMNFIETQLEPKVTFIDGKYHLEFNSKVFVKDVFVSTTEQGEFSANFFDVLPNVTKTIIFEPEDKKKKDLKFDTHIYNR
jgi:beta-mannosidase